MPDSQAATNERNRSMSRSKTLSGMHPSAYQEGSERPAQQLRCWRWRPLCETMVVVVFLMMVFSGGVGAYNVDTDTALVHEGDQGSMFGFSVAQHIDQSTNWLLIGAPRAQTSQPGVQKGGAVYRCRTDRLNSCQEVPFDPSGNNIRLNRTDFVDIEDKSNQWFGATVKSSGENGVIVACAPRYVYFSTTLDKREPVGTCYVSSQSASQYTEFSPCKEGQLYNFNTRDNKDYKSTNEGSPDEDDSYMGYASAVGDFDGDGADDYVVGIPKGATHLGKIAIFTQDLVNINNITGEQMGSYFGSALAVSDLNGDEKDDIIVGAPFYSNFEGLDYETGRVYIYYQTQNNEFKASRRDLLDGKQTKGRFGMALTHLGDINYDGYNDLAVGAPFGGEEGKGAVYIYHGSKKGIITQVSQVIHAKDVDPGLSTFGSALAGGWDQDGNRYPDMIVGSYASDKAIFLKTRPVVRVVATLSIDPKDINLEHKSCSLLDDTRVACMKVHTCLEYHGVGVPQELYFDGHWELDTLQRNLTRPEQRAFFTQNPTSFHENNTYRLTYKKIMCTTTYAFVSPDPLDKLTPIAVDFKFKLHERSPSGRRRRDLEPILDQYIPTSVRTEAQILKECGPDNVCVPDLSLVSFRVTAAYIIGASAEMEIMVIVENKKEDAYNTKLYVNLPPGVSFRNKASVKSVVPVSCGRLEDIMVVCDLGNPLPAGAQTSFTMRVLAKDTNETADALIFILQVNSTNPEDLPDTKDNMAKVEIPVTASADIDIFGKSEPEQVILNTSQIASGVDNSLRVEHVYQLKNVGPSSTKEVMFQIMWPSHDRRGNPILELDGKLQMNGTGSCQTFYITPENATKYGYARPGGGEVQIVLPGDQDEFEDAKKGDGVVLACSSRRCTVIQCIVGYLGRYDSFVLRVRSKLNVRSFIRWMDSEMNERRDQAQVYHIRSSASARIKSFPYNLTTVDVSKFATARHSIFTTVNTDRFKPGTKKVDVWVIAVSITAGLLVLLLLVLLLWWCGFFRRRRPEDEGYMVAGVKSSNVDNKIYE